MKKYINLVRDLLAKFSTIATIVPLVVLVADIIKYAESKIAEHNAKLNASEEVAIGV